MEEEPERNETQHMTEVLLDSFWDTLKALPILFIVYAVFELLEQVMPDKLKFAAARMGALGPLIGAALGLIPQCGVSAAAASLYASGFISPGTLIAVFLATSDEAVPIMLAGAVSVDLLYLLAAKFLFGVLFGYLTDLLLARRLKKQPEIAPPDAGCEEGTERYAFLWEAVKRTLHIGLVIFLANVLFGAVVELMGEGFFKSLFLEGTLFTPFLSALLGLFPNCATSVIITELYLSGQLGFAGTIAGLCTGAGVGLIVLFKNNRPIKESLLLLLVLYLSGSLSGLLLLLCGVHP